MAQTIKQLGACFAGRDKQERVNGDRIIRMHKFDDTRMNQALVLTVTLVFSAILDPDILRNSLSQLIETGEWRKIGGRLRKNKDGFLEIHIPEPFTPDRPAVSYSHEKFECTIDKHPIARQIPLSRAKSDILFMPIERYSELCAPPGAPFKVAHYLNRDESQLSLRVNSFEDGTLISLNFPHTLTDASGIGTLLRAWSNVLNGQAHLVPQRIGAWDDHLSNFASNPARSDTTSSQKEESAREKEPSRKEKSPISSHQLSHFGVARLVLSILRFSIAKPKRVRKYLRIPSAALSALRASVLKDIQGTNFPVGIAKRNDPTQPYLTSGDIIVGLFAHAASLPTNRQNRDMTVVNVYDVRGRVPDIFPTSRTDKGEPVYIGNATFWGYIYLDSSSLSLADIAVEARTQLLSQITPSQIHSRVSAEKKALDGKANLPEFFFPRNSYPMMFTSWMKADVYNAVDFQAAVVGEKRRREGSGKGGGRLRYLCAQSLEVVTSPVDYVHTTGRDADGDWWIDGMLREDVWREVEREIKKWVS